MRKDSIDQKAIEAAYLIYSEKGHQIVDYDFSHAPTDYNRGTVMEPESNGKLRQSFNEILPNKPQNEKFNSLQRRDDEIEEAIENLQQEMKVSRQRGAFQQLQNQMRQMNALIKEKERIEFLVLGFIRQNFVERLPQFAVRLGFLNGATGVVSWRVREIVVNDLVTFFRVD
jgi:hypothetical protein